MPRSADDATRFTATGPYATTKPSSSSGPSTFTSNASPTPISAQGVAASSSGTEIRFGSAPAGETPQQKIARLRAAAAIAKRGKESQFEQVVRVGRSWADRAHRFTALSLIGLTVISGAVATAGITDMLLHNRRRRNQWLAEKQAESARDLAIAKRAQVDGTATEDQLLLINRERVLDEVAEAKRNKPGIFKRATGWLYTGLADEERKGGRLGGAIDPTSETKTLQSAKDTMRDIAEGISPRRREGEGVLEMAIPGGPLDRQAQALVSNATSATKSWTSWITGSKH